MIINQLLNRLKLKYFIAKRTLGYTVDYVDILYKIYLNHNKVIHYRGGFPVYSLSTPALFSKPAANFLARAVYKGIQNKNLPNLISFAVNDICNANCQHCSFFSAVEDKSRKVLNLEQAKKLIRDAQELGVSTINFVGGEPSLREDMPEIIASVDKNQSTTVMFTNGFLLKENILSYKKAGLDSVYISLDSANPEIHDMLRGRKGLFDKAVEGILEAKKFGMSCGISATLTPESYAKGEFDKIIEFGKQIGIHEVLIFDSLPTGRLKKREDLVDNNAWVEAMIEESKKYNNDSSYPGVLLFAYATSFRSVGCSCGTSYFYIIPYGDVCSCDFNHAVFGNILEKPLFAIWEELSSSPDFLRAKWGGCKVKDSATRSQASVRVGKSCGCPE
ncbi:MAG: radical SAM protein [Patescibacteria group bacterium]